MRRLALLAVAIAAGPAAGGDPLHAVDEDLGGPASRWAEALVAVARRGDASVPEEDRAAPVGLTCVATPGDAKYVGIVQRMEIAAPLEAVARVLDDVPHYKDLFPGLVDVHEVPGSRDGNRYVTAWEQRVPVFFIPNVRYELTYLVARTSDARVVYRYRLARAGSLTHSDGVVALEAAGVGRTRFAEWDFFDARWGILPERAVWRESVGGAFASDVAVKLRAEHPDWSYARIAAETERLRRAADGEVEACLRHRTDAAEAIESWTPAERAPRPAPAVPASAALGFELGRSERSSLEP